MKSPPHDSNNGLSAGVAEQACDLACYGRHNRGIEQGVESCEKERADYNGNKDFYTTIYIALSFAVGDSCLRGYDYGVYFVFEFLEHN